MIVKNIIKKYIKKYIDRVYIYFKVKDKELIEKRMKLLSINLGEGITLNGEAYYFSNFKKIITGNNIHIGNNFYANTEGGLIIGHNTHISNNVTINSTEPNFEGEALPFDLSIKQRPVIIEENVWIGSNVVILPGIRVGHGAIIQTGTIVNRDVNPLEIVGSANILTKSSRPIDHYEILNRKKAYVDEKGKVISDAKLASFFKTYKDKRHKPIVFVLGTGRSGSNSITNILNQHSTCKAYHEEIRQLIRISTEIICSDKFNKCKEELDSIFKYKIWSANDEEILVHSDQRFWNLVSYLTEYFPNAKFIHLIREPVSCIKSMVLRNWYKKDEYPKLYLHDWAKFRLQGDELGAFTEEEWGNMNKLEKCTWYYFYINNSIAGQLKKLPADKYYTLSLDQLDEKINELQHFIGLKKESLTVVKSNTIRMHDLENARKIDVLVLEQEILEEIQKYDFESSINFFDS